MPALGAPAYYLILAFFPFIIFLMTLVGYSPISSDRVLNSLLQMCLWAYNIIQKTISEVVNTRVEACYLLTLFQPYGLLPTGRCPYQRLKPGYDEKKAGLFGKSGSPSFYLNPVYSYFICIYHACIWWGY